MTISKHESSTGQMQQIPAWEQLSAEQQAELADIGWPDAGTKVELPVYGSFEEFKEAFIPNPEAPKKFINNFPLYFAEDDTLAGFYRYTPVFRRLNVIRPDLVEEIKSSMDKRGATELARDDKILHLLLEAHTTMSNLVRSDDPGAVRDGKPVQGYLTL